MPPPLSDGQVEYTDGAPAKGNPKIPGARPEIYAYGMRDPQGLFQDAEGRLFATRRLALVGGATLGTARRDYASVAVRGVATTFNLKASKTYDWLAPRIGLLWENESGTQVFANLLNNDLEEE